MVSRAALAALTALAACACVLVAISERGSRSPSALLGQKLYYPAYYPYGGVGGYDGNYGYGYNPYGYGYGYSGYPYYPYDYGYGDNGAYNQYAAYAAQAQYQDQVSQQQYADYAQQQNYQNYLNQYNAYAAAAAQKASPGELKVADKNTNKLVYLGDLEFGGYRHDITGGNDGGYNAPFDLNGDGQYVDNWGKVATSWKHKKGSQQLEEKKEGVKHKQSQLRNVVGGEQLAREPPADAVWQAGFANHPGPVPNEAAPMRPWYWRLGYLKYGHLTG